MASRQQMLVVLAAFAILALADPGQPETVGAGTWVDPNLQTEGFQASLTAEQVIGNPLGLIPAVIQGDSVDGPPNGGVTFSSQHNAEVSRDAENLWSWEFDGYNVENVGLATVHNLKDPKWPVVYTLFESTSSPDFAPVVNGEIDRESLEELASYLTDGNGLYLGYSGIFDAINDTALGVVVRMGADPTQAIFGILGNDENESDLEGGADLPIDVIPDEEEEPVRRRSRSLLKVPKLW